MKTPSNESLVSNFQKIEASKAHKYRNFISKLVPIQRKNPSTIASEFSFGGNSVEGKGLSHSNRNYLKQRIDKRICMK